MVRFPARAKTPPSAAARIAARPGKGVGKAFAEQLRAVFRLKTIKSKILFAMLFVAVIAASPLALEHIATKRILSRIDGLINADIPTMSAASDIALAVQRIVSEVEAELLNDRIRSNRRKAIAFHMGAIASRLKTIVELERQRAGTESDNSAFDTKVTEIDKALHELEIAVAAVFSAHDLRLGYTFYRDGHNYTADTFAAKLKYDFASLLRRQTVAVYLGGKITEGIDAADTDIGRWIAEYRTEDEALKKLLEALGDANKQAAATILRVQEASQYVRAEIFERNRNLISLQMDEALDNISNYMGPILEKAQVNERQETDKMGFAADNISSATVELSTIAKAALDRAEADVSAISIQVGILSTAAGAMAILIALVVSLVVTRSLSRPLGMIAKDMDDLAKGDFDIALKASSRTDEFGDLSRLVGVFLDNSRTRLMLEDEAAKDSAARSLRQERLQQLIQNFDGRISVLAGSLGAGATQMEQTAMSLNEISAEAMKYAAAVASSSDEAASNVQTVAVSCEQLSASVGEIAARVAQTNGMIMRADTDSQEANQRVVQLAETASRIGAVVNLINTIAGQTNLLALNATIEAARAGEAGRGFAVVAAEVKALSSQTAKATDEIASQVRAIQSETNGAVQSIEAIAMLMSQVAEHTSAIAAAVEEQGAATNEISRNIRAAADGTSDVSRNMFGVNEASEKTSASADQVLSTAGSLGGEITTLREEVDRFLSSVRAA